MIITPLILYNNSNNYQNIILVTTKFEESLYIFNKNNFYKFNYLINDKV